MVLDLFLIAALGFLGSFGHCVGMCGPLTVAFSLSNQSENTSWWKQSKFHILLNSGRMLSYSLVGAAIGALGSVLLEGGQLAGVGSELRQWIAIITGIMLILFGLRQINPNFLPRIPFLHPLLQGGLHNRLNAGMSKLSLQNSWYTPALLGMTWGLMPCGFLYTAQIKAAQTGNMWMGAATMLAFGLGTFPIMLGVGVSASLISKDKRSQLFRLGGWVTLTIGVITLLRTGDTMVDYTGHAGLILLMLTLIARPISSLWAAPMRYRRALGVVAFVVSLAHTAHMMEHSLSWKLNSFFFLPSEFQLGMAFGAVALVLMIPAALTSFDSLHLNNFMKIHLSSFFIPPASAHKIETAEDVGATLHIEPNDTPRAGEAAQAWFALTRRGVRLFLSKSAIVSWLFTANPEKQEQHHLFNLVYNPYQPNAIKAYREQKLHSPNPELIN